MLEAALKETQVYELHKRFRDGRASTKDNSRLAAVKFYK
jgi:hypothetical protein